MIRDIPFEPANEANETYGKPRLSLVAFSMDFTTGSLPPAMVNWQDKLVTTTTFRHLLIKTRKYQDDELAALRNVVISHFYCNYQVKITPILSLRIYNLSFKSPLFRKPMIALARSAIVYFFLLVLTPGVAVEEREPIDR
jgi:hypothetical protein